MLRCSCQSVIVCSRSPDTQWYNLIMKSLACSKTAIHAPFLDVRNSEDSVRTNLWRFETTSVRSSSQTESMITLNELFGARRLHIFWPCANMVQWILPKSLVPFHSYHTDIIRIAIPDLKVWKARNRREVLLVWFRFSHAHHVPVGANPVRQVRAPVGPHKIMVQPDKFAVFGSRARVTEPTSGPSSACHSLDCATLMG